MRKNNVKANCLKEVGGLKQSTLQKISIFRFNLPELFSNNLVHLFFQHTSHLLLGLFGPRDS